MKKVFSLVFATLTLLSISPIFAGNPDRVGQAGATELLVNPWARSSGWNGANAAEIIGVESMNFNPSGLVSIPNTEIMFARTTYLSGSDIYINGFGIAQKIGKDKTGAIGISVTSFDFGDIQITTVQNPEGGLGTYSPTFTNIGLSYAHKFSNRIRTGITFRIISESIPDAKASGICLDAGLQYIADITGKDEDKSKFSVSLRNVGTPMKFGGDGLTRRGTFEGSEIPLSVDTKSASFDLPTLLNIALSQDFYIDTKHFHKLTAAGSFVSNSFAYDQYAVGLQYSLKNILLLRGSMLLEKGTFSSDNDKKKNIHSGPAAGFTVNIPFGKNKDKSFAVDYSYRATVYFQGTHCFGARIIL
jgi:hypothetical protein